MMKMRKMKSGWRKKWNGIAAALLWAVALPPVLAADQTAQPRIVGGVETTQSWPWMAALVDAAIPNAYQGLFCGASLIDSKWVATAAHCVAGAVRQLPADVDIVLGVHNLQQDLQNGIGQRLKIKRIVTHSQYDSVGDDFDIALLELQQAVSNTPVPLYTGADSLVGQNVLALGWGNTESRGISNYPAALQEVLLPIVSNTTCAAAMKPYAITDNMLCAGYVQGGKDTCDGDSGGPLLVNLNGYQLAGLTSWGFECAQQGYYGVYTRVASFNSFIQDSLKKDYFACADQNGDGVVNEADRDQKRDELRKEYRQWLQQCWSTQTACGDVNSDGVVNNTDKKARRRAMNNQFFYWQQSCWYPERQS